LTERHTQIVTVTLRRPQRGRLEGRRLGRSSFEVRSAQAGNVIQLDFASDSLNHFVQSPGVTIEIKGPIVAEPMASG
jgi:hypothetical protein